MNKGKFILILLLIFLLGSCSTSIPVQVTKPSPMKLHRFNKITVFPFEYQKNDNTASIGTSLKSIITSFLKVDQSEQESDPLSFYLTSRLTEKVSNSGYFEVISHESLDKNSENLANQVEAYITGYIYTQDSSDEGMETKVVTPSKNSDTTASPEKETEEVWYGINRTEVEISYKIIRSSDFVVISSRNHTYEKESKGYDWKEIDSFEELHKQAIDEALDDMAYNLLPREVTEYRRLMKDKIKDPDFDQADELVKNRQYRQAYDQFKNIYVRTGNPAAGINAAILKEILGDLPEAIIEMENMVQLTGEKKAASELRRMQQTLIEQQEMENR